MTEKQPSLSISPYTYLPGREMIISASSSKTKIRMMNTENDIIRLLAKYRILERYMIDILLKLHGFVEQKWSCKDTVSTLYNAGYLKKYEYPNEDDKVGTQIIAAYALSTKGIRYAEKKKWQFHYEPLPDSKRYDTPTVLEVLTQNLWHCSILQKYKGKIEDEQYELTVSASRNRWAVIPSLFKINDGRAGFRGRISVAAIPLKKNDDGKPDQSVVLNTTLVANAFLSESITKYKSSIIVVICDNFDQMEGMHKFIKSHKVLEQLSVFYTLDYFVRNDEDPLNWLFICKEEDGVCSYTHISLSARKSSGHRTPEFQNDSASIITENDAI